MSSSRSRKVSRPQPSAEEATPNGARFMGSVQHKDRTSRWGPPARPCDKDICPAEIPDEEVRRVLERDITRAIQKGHCSASTENAWPRYVWGRSTFEVRPRKKGIDAVYREIPWEARLTNSGLGEYKAWPARQDRHHADMPPEVEALLWPT